MKSLALFPLRNVLFPGGQLALRVFETRYLDLMSRCLREQQPFGVVCITEGDEVGKQPLNFEPAGTLAHLGDVDAEAANILRVLCKGGQRFTLCGQATQDAQGLWRADVQLLADDPPLAPPSEHGGLVRALYKLVAHMQNQGINPFAEPHGFDDAAWIANRWCETLPFALPTKHDLMMLPDPLARLALVQEYMSSRSMV